MAKIEILGVQHDYQWTPSQSDSAVAVVFVHGWLLSQQYWRPVMERVQAQFSCLSYDLRGFGESDLQTHAAPLLLDYGDLQNSVIASLAIERCQVSPFSPAAFGRDLLLLLKRLNLKQVWLVGHSLGGTIAIWAAAMCQQKDFSSVQSDACIKGIIGLNAGGGIYVQEDFDKFRTAGQYLLRLRPSWLARIPGLAWMFSYSNVASSVGYHWGQQLLTDFLRANPEAGKLSLLDSTTSEEVLLLPHLVKRLQQPAYFIAGKQDRVMEPKFVNHLASFHPLFHTPTRNVFELKNCGHLGMIEQPQQVSDLILKLINRHRET